MQTGLLAKRYAKALFDLALERKVLEEVRKDMTVVIDVCNESRELMLLLKTPVVNAEKKQKILKSVFEGHIEALSLAFVLLITKHRREVLLVEIARQFIEIYNSYKNITVASFITPVVMDEAIRKEVIATLSAYTKGEIDLIEETNPDLVGGFVLKFDSKQYDASLRRELNALRKEFDRNLYVREY